MIKVLEVLKQHKDRIFSPYQSMFLYGVVVFVLLEVVPFYSNRNTWNPFMVPLSYSWWENQYYLILYLSIIIFIVKPLQNYMYSIKYKPIHQLFTFWYKAVICNLFSSIASIIGLLLLVLPMFYINYRFMFLPLYVIEKHEELSSFEIIKLCWKDGNSYKFIEVFCLGIIIQIIGRFFTKFNFLTIFILPIYIGLYQTLYIYRDEKIVTV